MAHNTPYSALYHTCIIHTHTHTHTYTHTLTHSLTQTHDTHNSLNVTTDRRVCTSECFSGDVREGLLSPQTSVYNCCWYWCGRCRERGHWCGCGYRSNCWHSYSYSAVSSESKTSTQSLCQPVGTLCLYVCVRETMTMASPHHPTRSTITWIRLSQSTTPPLSSHHHHHHQELPTLGLQWQRSQLDLSSLSLSPPQDMASCSFNSPTLGTTLY